MSSVEYLREFVNERLTAAAEEIFGVFKRTIVEYEEEIDRQRRLLDIVWKPDIKLHRIELPQQHVCKEEEVLSDQQLCILERNSSLDQEDPEPPQIKEEQDELCTSQEGVQLVLKQETDAFMVTSTDEESDYGEALNFSLDDTQSVVKEKHLNYISVNSSVVQEPNSDHLLLFHNSQSQDQDHEHGDSGPTRNAETVLHTQHHNSNSHTDSTTNPAMVTFHCDIQTGKKSVKCGTCGKTFRCKSYLQRHLLTHTGEKPYSCNTCGKRFSQTSILKAHTRVHTGEKPHCCITCGKRFLRISDLKNHVRVHTGERPYSCKMCGKAFARHSCLLVHMRIHADMKPHTCTTCGKNFRTSGQMTRHLRTHTGEKPYSCSACGKRFGWPSLLAAHTRIHTGERPYSCKTCGKVFRLKSALKLHMSTHTGEKPYTCVTCGRAFSFSTNLISHTKIHTGEKPFSCNICGKDFRRNYELRVHTRRTSVEYLREFVIERLTAAADEIFGVFKRTIVEYEEEIDRQRRLLDIVWKPEIKLHSIELPQHHAYREEMALPSQQLCIQESNSSLDQEDQEPPQVKEEQEEPRSAQEEKQLVLKQETDAFMLTPTYDESDHSDDHGLNFIIDETQNVVEDRPLNYISVNSSVAPEPTSERSWFFSHNSQSQDQDRGEHGDLGSTRIAGSKQQNQHYKSNSYYINITDPTIATIHYNTHTGKKSFKCNLCEKVFRCKSDLKRHLKIHTGEKPYSCNTCGKRFNQPSILKAHIRLHTGEKPYLCNTCGERFCRSSDLKAHIRVHTGEKPHLCKTCGKDFRSGSHLKVHMRTHTGEKPYTCQTCGRAFRLIGHLIGHIRTHTGEKPYSCKTCGKNFRLSGTLKDHMRRMH
ncbi:zinc finger protein 665-like [Epinephelus moara]|uniref:zinc finger protein 665-like n=1 Tax=Epinephelus moara TaxID=300413 RepID=UPI00214F1715|nr:zinc finger protein 665-like [Epinephelus moara]